MALLVAFALLSHAASARAQSAAAAQALFQEARKLMEKGDYGAACKKLEDSQKLDPAPGTLFNLAHCFEKNGQTASAWVTFKSAASAYKSTNRPDWETKARDRAEALEPRLSHLTIVTDGQGVEIRRDGTKIATSELGVEIPVDPGPHTVEASAPNKKPWSSVVKVAADGGRERVRVPVLELLPQPAARSGSSTGPDKPIEEPPPSSTQKTLAFVAGGLGVIGLGVGAATGLMAVSENDKAKQLCPTEGACSNRQGVDASDSAKSFGTVSTVSFVAGGALLVTGVVLYLTAPSSSKASGRASIAPFVGVNQLGMVGSF